MYRFLSFEYGWLHTCYSPKEIAGFNCFDAFDNGGNSIVVSSDNVDFKSFEYENL